MVVETNKTRSHVTNVSLYSYVYTIYRAIPLSCIITWSQILTSTFLSALEKLLFFHWPTMPLSAVQRCCNDNAYTIYCFWSCPNIDCSCHRNTSYLTKNNSLRQYPLAWYQLFLSVQPMQPSRQCMFCISTAIRMNRLQTFYKQQNVARCIYFKAFFTAHSHINSEVEFIAMPYLSARRLTRKESDLHLQ